MNDPSINFKKDDSSADSGDRGENKPFDDSVQLYVNGLHFEEILTRIKTVAWEYKQFQADTNRLCYDIAFFIRRFVASNPGSQLTIVLQELLDCLPVVHETTLMVQSFQKTSAFLNKLAENYGVSMQCIKHHLKIIVTRTQKNYTLCREPLLRSVKVYQKCIYSNVRVLYIKKGRESSSSIEKKSKKAKKNLKLKKERLAQRVDVTLKKLESELQDKLSRYLNLHHKLKIEAHGRDVYLNGVMYGLSAYYSAGEEALEHLLESFPNYFQEASSLSRSVG